jgi:hypothetical protein
MSLYKDYYMGLSSFLGVEKENTDEFIQIQDINSVSAELGDRSE